MKDPPEQLALKDPEEQLAMMYFSEYLRSRGYTILTAFQLPEKTKKLLLTDASTYAACKLTEVEDRAKVIEEIHGISQAE